MSASIGAVRRLPIWRPLSGRAFRLLWSSETVSLVGDQFHYVALSWLVITLTGSGLALGAVLIAVAVPRAILLVPFGVVADRRPSRSLLIVANLSRGVIVGAMAALVLAGQASIPLLAGLGALFGVADALYLPAQQALLPRIVGAPDLPPANAMLQGTVQLTSLVGPPAAGAAIAIVGTGPAFVVDSASFFAAAAIVALMVVPGALARPAAPAEAEAGAGEEPEPAQPPFLVALREGLSYVGRDPAIRTLMLIALALNLAFNGPIGVGMAWLAERRFDAGPAGLGWLLAGWAGGALLGTLVAGNARLERQGAIVLGLMTLAGVGMGAIAVIGSLPVLVLVLAAMGAAVGYVNIVAISWLQARVERALLGRVMSLVMLMSFGITPLSLGLAGVLIDIDARGLFLGAGALVLAAVALSVATRLPALLDAAPSPAATAPAGPAG